MPAYQTHENITVEIINFLKKYGGRPVARIKTYLWQHKDYRFNASELYAVLEEMQKDGKVEMKEAEDSGIHLWYLATPV